MSDPQQERAEFDKWFKENVEQMDLTDSDLVVVSLDPDTPVDLMHRIKSSIGEIFADLNPDIEVMVVANPTRLSTYQETNK